MNDDDQEIVYSPLCQTITRDGKSVDVMIYGDGDGGWLLEVVDQYGNSTAWDLPFSADAAALDEVFNAIDEDGIESLIGLPSEAIKPQPYLGADTLTDEELEELNDFLMSDATSDETMMIDCLDGFLTAIVSGPVMLKPGVWLPKVWGPSARDEPVFKNYAEAERIVGLIMRHFNSIVESLQHNPDTHEPIFDLALYPDDTVEYVDAEMWAYGYVAGIDLQGASWESFFDDPVSDEVLRPIHLLGANDVTPEEEALVKTPAQRQSLSKQIPGSAAWIYKFWQPYRQAVAERTIATTYQREHPKVGRNDPCPCGSGKKFKKCCGASAVLH